MLLQSNPFTEGLERNAANYVPLTPLSLLHRTVKVYPNRLAVVHGERRFLWRDVYQRCCRLASALRQAGVGPGSTVAVMLPNVPAIFEAHFGVAMAGGVLNTLNVRLDAEAIAFMLKHGEAKVLLTDPEYSPIIEKALALLADEGIQPLVVDVLDALGPAGKRLGKLEYEEFLAGGDPDFQWEMPEDEWGAITLNYTSGTTGNPKGVVYHHRGAYINALGNAVGWNMGMHPVYLWTLPMFHCNGWCFPWTLAAVAGTSVCLRKVEAKSIYSLIAEHRVTHMCGAPIVLATLINAPVEDKRPFPTPLNVMVAGAAPPASVIKGMDALGATVTQAYGLTETYGPAVSCAWHPEWDGLPEAERYEHKSRAGVHYQVLEDLQVMDPATMQPVPRDGETVGEVMFRGNIVMMGYLKNPAATREAFAGGWFHSGDLAVMHPDGYIQIKDRSKDIVISGGENIASLEVEDVLCSHPAVMEAAIVAKPDERWGEVPAAYINLKPGMAATSDELIDFCRRHLARYKCPKIVVFGPLPRTSTGKVQKYLLRQHARGLG